MKSHPNFTGSAILLNEYTGRARNAEQLHQWIEQKSRSPQFEGDKDFNRFVNTVFADSYQVTGKTTFKEEFVTCGGISLADVNPITMESRKLPGLFFAGEVMDIDGITGGYNFQAAWTTGWIAGG